MRRRLGEWRSVGDGEEIRGMGRSLREWSLGSGVVCGVCDWGETIHFVGETAVGILLLTPTSSTNKVSKCTPHTCTACPALSRLSWSCSLAVAGGVSGP